MVAVSVKSKGSGSRSFEHQEFGIVGIFDVDWLVQPQLVYRGETSQALIGIYYNSDFCSGRVQGLTRDDAGAWVYQGLLDTTLLVTGAGQDEAGEVYLTACQCVFERDYNPFDNPTGKLWRVVSADQVPERGEIAPLRQPDEPEATPAPEGAEMVGTPDAGQ